MSTTVGESAVGTEGVRAPADPQRRRRRPVAYPLLFAVFPIVFLLARNTAEDVSLADVLVPVGVTLAATVSLLLALRLLIHDLHATALATTVLILLFFSFGHVVHRFDPSGFGEVAPKLLPAYGLLAAAAVLAAVRFRTRYAALTDGLNAIAAILVLMNLIPAIQLGDRAQASVPSSPIHLSAPSTPRDVYYLIFDRYANVQTLTTEFGSDGDPFLDSLRDRGFFVAEDSVANYPKTAHSLASSLNAELLGPLADEFGTDARDWDPIFARLQDFRVARAFRSIGYRYVHLGSWWSPTREDPTADENLTYGRLSEFSSVLLDTTIWPELSRSLGISDSVGFERTQYERARYQFRMLAGIPDDPRPTFTFAHLTLPHPPYVFDADGGYVTPAEAERDLRQAYLDQLAYTNERIDALVDTLLDGRDETDPIIVIQSDEGPHPDRLEADEEHFDWTRATDAELSEKLRILNAYYLPGDGSPQPYPAISPVNTFRLIFDRYFGADLPLLSDRTWVFQDFDHPYRFTEVTDRLT